MNSRPRVLLIDPPFHRLYRNDHPFIDFSYPQSLSYLALSIKARTAWDVMIYGADFFPVQGRFKYRYLAGRGFRHYRRSLARTIHEGFDV